jgi:hypothetical protein
MDMSFSLLKVWFDPTYIVHQSEEEGILNMLFVGLATLQNFYSKTLTTDQMAEGTWVWYNDSKKHQTTVEGVPQCLQCWKSVKEYMGNCANGSRMISVAWRFWPI